ncbi:helix-turn-helix domain-containing protein [Gemmatimonas sp.]
MTKEKHFPLYAQRLRRAVRDLERSTGESWSHARIAKAAGKDRRSVSNWLGGRNEPRGDSLIALAQLLRTSPEWICGQGGEHEMRGRDFVSFESQIGLHLIDALKRERSLSGAERLDSEGLGRAALALVTQQLLREYDLHAEHSEKVGNVWGVLDAIIRMAAEFPKGANSKKFERHAQSAFTAFGGLNLRSHLELPLLTAAGHLDAIFSAATGAPVRASKPRKKRARS